MAYVPTFNKLKFHYGPSLTLPAKKNIGEWPNSPPPPFEKRTTSSDLSRTAASLTLVGTIAAVAFLGSKVISATFSILQIIGMNETLLLNP
jgi:hypothetical protein